ncbi:aspartate--tRNA(Asn) ligase, partial [Candidatus Woesearchaeota archaeon]|nr:aspartate--tRNA(Asn) ligase [Candidatus Woesearchaeota archaeon]
MQENLYSKKIPIKEIFDSSIKDVEIGGWVKNTRALGKIKFIVLRDTSGEIQITGVENEIDKKIFEIMDKIPRESVIYVKGNVKTSQQAPGGKEVIPLKLEILNKSEELLPIDVSEFSKTELPKRLD